MKLTDDSLASRMRAVETRLAAVETAHDATRRSVIEHEEWMRAFDVKLDAIKDSMSAIRSEMRSSSRERAMGFVLILILIFVFFVFVLD